MWGFQLWVNLPARDKLTAPRYQDIDADRIPEVQLSEGVRARVIAGSLAGAEGPVSGVATEPVYFDLHMGGGKSVQVPLPPEHNAFVYVYQGRAAVESAQGSVAVERGELGLLSHGKRLNVAASDDGCRLIVVAGRPLNEPIARYGPFVMNTTEEIHQAFEDFRAGRL